MIALRPYHADRIYRGLKSWEFRRAHASIEIGATVFIYESGKVGKVTGEFTVAEKVLGHADLIAGLEPNKQSQEDADRYLLGAMRATALRVSGVLRYVEPLGLADIGLARAPQSYCRVPAEVAA